LQSTSKFTGTELGYSDWHVKRVQDWFDKVGRNTSKVYLKEKIKEDFLEPLFHKIKTFF